MSHKTVSAGWESRAALRGLPPGLRSARPDPRIKKEQKHYHYDWSLVPSEPARFENLVAVSPLKWVHFEQDAQGREVELRYFRDTDGRR